MSAPTHTAEELTGHLLDRVELVQRNLECEAVARPTPADRFADLLDSMGMVEFLAILAEDCGVTPMAIERVADRRFGTVAELAHALRAAGLVPKGQQTATPPVAEPQTLLETPPAVATCWLAATAVCMPDTIQTAASLNEALHRPPGWLETHAGIEQRRVWADQDPLSAAAVAGRECLERAGLLAEEVGALLVTSEAPPLLAGLAAALHQRLDLRPETVSLEVGGACTGFLAALWLAQTLVAGVGVVLVVAVEAPSHYLRVEPGAAGEAAALFGDAAAASVLAGRATGPNAVPLAEVVLNADGSAGHLLQVTRSAAGLVALHMEGSALAGRALRGMADGVRDLVRRHGLALGDVHGVVAHGGNGRLPALLARRLGLEPERVWSETPRTGNLGSASLPVAWAARQGATRGPVAWTAAGAGLTWGAALTGVSRGG